MSESKQPEPKQGYESDGVMGEKKKDTADNYKQKQEEPMFFNTTPSSE